MTPTITGRSAVDELPGPDGRAPMSGDRASTGRLGDRVFGARIRKTVRFAEAPVKGMSVLKYDPTGTAADAYRQLAKEVLSNGKR